MRKAGIRLLVLLGGAILIWILLGAGSSNTGSSYNTITRTCNNFADAENFINSYKSSGYRVKCMLGDKYGCLIVMEKN